MKKTFLVIFSLFVTILFSSCASILSDSSYPVAISSSPDGANIEIRDSMSNVIYKGTTPSMVNLDASSGFFKKATYTVTFSKDGYEDSIYSLSSGIDGWYWGNILVGGFVGMLIVDPATGSMWSLDSAVFVNLTESVDSNTISIMNIEDIPKSWKPYLVKLV